jgi:hypothetical protein
MLDIDKCITEVERYQDDGDGYHNNGYDQLKGDWLTYYKIARYFVHKVKREDREDFLHDLMIEMAKVKAKYKVKGKPLTEAGLMRIASYELTDYWHTLMRHRPTMLSLNYADDFDGDGQKTELMEFLADDKAIDIVARLDARRYLLGCPRRIVQIAYKKYAGYPLNAKEQHHLEYWRKKTDQLKFGILTTSGGDSSGSTV